MVHNFGQKRGLFPVCIIKGKVHVFSGFRDMHYIRSLRIIIIELYLWLHMKKICCFTLMAIVSLVTVICAAEVPDLLGKWNGSWTSYDGGKGLHNMTENET